MFDKVKFGAKLLIKHKYILLFFITVYAYLLPMLWWLYFDQTSIALKDHSFFVKQGQFHEKIVIDNPKDSCLVEFRGQFKNNVSGETILYTPNETSVVSFYESNQTIFERQLDIPEQILYNPYMWDYITTATYTCNPIKRDLYTLDTVKLETIVNDATIINP